MSSMLQSFIYRGSQPRPMAQPNPKRISTPAGQRLSVIIEGAGVGAGAPAAAATDADTIAGGEDTEISPAAATTQTATTSSATMRPPPRITNSSYEHRLHIGEPPSFGEEKRPPSYMSGHEGQTGTPNNPGRPYNLLPSGMRENMSRRGGWKRVMLFAAILLVVILAIALGVGLGVGLSRHHSSSSSSSSSTGSNSNSTNTTSQPFPAGSWSFETYLTSTSTNCTSNSALWTCPPYSDYSASSPSASLYTFNWQISSSSSGSNQYQISSADPFGIAFTSIPLTLNEVGTQTEHYSFQLPNVSKQVIPAISLFANDAATICFFNETVVTASLFTRTSNSSQSTSTSSMTTTTMTMQSSEPFMVWPFAVSVQVVAAGGSGVPSCYQSVNQRASGPVAQLDDEPTDTQCNCMYSNYNLS